MTLTGTAEESDWTVTYEDFDSREVTTVRAAGNRLGPDGMWELVDSGEQPVFQVPVQRLISARRPSAAPAPAIPLTDGEAGALAGLVNEGRLAVDTCRRIHGLAPLGLPETTTPRAENGGSARPAPETAEPESAASMTADCARLLGSPRLAAMAQAIQKIDELRREGTAPVTFETFLAAWEKACDEAWKDGRSPAVRLPEFMWPRIAQLINPVTLEPVTVVRVPAFPAQAKTTGTDHAAPAAPAGDGPGCRIRTQGCPSLRELDLLRYAQAMNAALGMVRAAVEARARDGLVPAGPILMAIDQPYRFPLPGDAAFSESLDSKATVFARKHGSFILRFDATRNYTRPGNAPWTLTFDGGRRGWAGFTAESVLDIATSGLTGDKASPAAGDNAERGSEACE